MGLYEALTTGLLLFLLVLIKNGPRFRYLKLASYLHSLKHEIHGASG